MTPAVSATSPDLEIDGLTVRFGGRTAVDALTLRARAGAVTGLIGPNGAGKTTTFNACTGLVRPAAGTVRLGGRTLDGSTPARRAQLGLGRTFQRMRVIDTMTAVENVALGPEARRAGRGWRHQLWAHRREWAECLAAAGEAMGRCGISHLAGVPAGELSTGQCRLVELARALSSGFRFLLLDEPSSGLDEAETEHVGRILAGVVRDEGIGVLLVEHDLDLVRQVCTSAYVLDFGQRIAEGPTADVLSAEVVRAAYLGTAEVA